MDSYIIRGKKLNRAFWKAETVKLSHGSNNLFLSRYLCKCDVYVYGSSIFVEEINQNYYLL